MNQDNLIEIRNLSVEFVTGQKTQRAIGRAAGREGG